MNVWDLNAGKVNTHDLLPCNCFPEPQGHQQLHSIFVAIYGISDFRGAFGLTGVGVILHEMQYFNACSTEITSNSLELQ